MPDIDFVADFDTPLDMREAENMEDTRKTVLVSKGIYDRTPDTILRTSCGPRQGNDDYCDRHRVAEIPSCALSYVYHISSQTVNTQLTTLNI